MNLRGKPAPLWGVLSSSKRKPSLTMLFLIFFHWIVLRSFDTGEMAHGICDRKTAGDSVEWMYNLIIKYIMYKKGRRGLRPDSLAWHKACGGVGERPFPKLAPCMDLARWMRTLAKDADLPNGRGREICRKEYKFD